MGFRTKKGDAPPTGRVKPSANFERTMTLASQMAAESVPEEHTVATNEQAPAVVARGRLLARDGQSASPARIDQTAAPVAAADPRLARVAIADVRPSPFQPKGRPSHDAVAAVRVAAGRAGGIAGLVGADGQAIFQTLPPEAKRLAELAFSVARDGVREPVEVRTAEDGSTEALSGHRRLAAALLAGLDAVPVLHRGTMSAAQAAATVLSGNLHREDFTPWQEAVLVTEVIAQRRADGLPADVRTVGAIMGYSHGRVSTLQTIRRVMSADVLAQLGEVTLIEDALARVANYSRLEEIARLGDETRRADALRRLLDLASATGGRVPAADPKAAFRHRPKRGGGFTIEVEHPIETLAAGDAATLRELLASQLARLDARLQALGRTR